MGIRGSRQSHALQSIGNPRLYLIQVYGESRDDERRGSRVHGHWQAPCMHVGVAKNEWCGGQRVTPAVSLFSGPVDLHHEGVCIQMPETSFAPDVFTVIPILLLLATGISVEPFNGRQ